MGPIAVDLAVVGGRLYTGLAEVTSDIGVLDGCGQWVVVLPYSEDPSGPTERGTQRPICARFDSVSPADGWPEQLVGSPTPDWVGPEPGAWVSSLDRDSFAKGVAVVREAIAAGDVYQVNLCRRLEASLADPSAGLVGLGARLARRHPAPHAAVVSLPSVGVQVASASPECFLRRRGQTVESQPIKGTATVPDGLTAKDRAENVMIVDLVRNDLGRVCEYGSVTVPGLWQVELHPGLAHLVSTVQGQLRKGTGWRELLDAVFPPGSVTGAPKQAALDMIARLEPVPRRIYCGAVGWVDADRNEAVLNVAIRTFWVEGNTLCFGTGAGITWDSSPEAEWAETELKASQLLALASTAPSPAVRENPSR